MVFYIIPCGVMLRGIMSYSLVNELFWVNELLDFFYQRIALIKLINVNLFV